jgi:uncharacterized membrane protein
MDTLGSTHLVFGIVALLAGTLVVLTPKGTRYHRTAGHLYFTSMLGLNLTGLMIYRLTGDFNFFHATALFSLACLLTGLLPVILRRPKKDWLHLHGSFMSGSYVGLVAAAVSEVVTRVPGWDFTIAVGAATALIVAVGIYLISTRMSAAIASIHSKGSRGD